MTEERQDATRLRVESLRQSGPTPFALLPDAPARTALAESLGAQAIRKLRFEGRLEPRGRDGWHLKATLGATVVQPCVVTLEPVTTRIDTEVERLYVPADRLAREAGSETEMDDEDDILEPLGPVIDLAAVMAESLALALPAYPRKEGADLGAARFAEDGVTPLSDEAVRPFAGLAGLREQLGKDDDEG
ncbi:YceD family protein [Thetidibacter halocola]|uniref:DUF177 domain-containing protein n=1 Tax=Thetidibacter halocola TaxID=2827239 RepID=A0A8J7WBR2_9RHOB|nr:DUF177 domain-containing protein [Thetidibacter halocola]MBS0122781.1 DUF177 domain-containing protein [Thetidibacter halocola]